MGFNSAVQRQQEFVPTTPKQLKEIEKRAKQREQEGKTRRAEKDSGAHKQRYPRGLDAIRAALQSHQPVRISRHNLFEKFQEICKARGIGMPAYRLYESQKEADASFMFDIQSCLARMTWQELAQLVDAGVGVPVVSRSATDAFWFAINVLVQAFQVADYLETKKGDKAWVTIQDRDALEEWPVAARKRRSSKDDKGEDKMLTDPDNRKLRASGDDEDEDDEDDAAPAGDEDEEDDDAEDDKPAAKSKGKRTGGFGSKKRAGATEEGSADGSNRKRAKRSATKVAEDDPNPTTKRGSKMASKATTADTTLSDTTTIKRIKDRSKGGPKTKLLELIPQRKGITLKALVAAATEQEVVAKNKVKPFVAFLIKHGYAATA